MYEIFSYKENVKTFLKSSVCRTWKVQLEERVAANKAKQKEQQEEQRKRRELWLEETRAEQAVYQSQYEKEFKAMRSQYAHEYGLTSSDEESEELEQLYCVACDKAFKSERAFMNHESSKKHQVSVALIMVHLVIIGHLGHHSLLTSSEYNRSTISYGTWIVMEQHE